MTLTPDDLNDIRRMLEIAVPLPVKGPFIRRMVTEYTPDDVAYYLRELVREVERCWRRIEELEKNQ